MHKKALQKGLQSLMASKGKLPARQSKLPRFGLASPRKGKSANMESSKVNHLEIYKIQHMTREKLDADILALGHDLDDDMLVHH